MSNERFTVNPFGDLTLTAEDRTELVDVANKLDLAKFEKYEEHLQNERRVDLSRWKKFTNSGPTTTFIERKNSNPSCKLPKSLMVGPLPGTLDENMFGLVSPTLEAMRIKSSYLNDFSAAAVLASIVEPTEEEPFRSIVVKWMEIDIPMASLGIVRNRDYVYLESSGILLLKNGERIGYHLLHSVSFPETHQLPNRVRGNMSFCAVFHQDGPDRTDCHGTGIMNPGGDMIRTMALSGMVQATMAGLKYSYCGQMKKLAWLLKERHSNGRDQSAPVVKNVVQGFQEVELYFAGSGAYPAKGGILREVFDGSDTDGHTGGCSASVCLPLGSQVYGRAGWYKDVWAIMYAWYFPKGFWMDFLSRRHDCKSVVVWIDNPDLEMPKILGVSMSKGDTDYRKETKTWPSSFAGYRTEGRRFNRTYIYGSNSSLRFEYHVEMSSPYLNFAVWDGEYQDLIMWEQLTDPARAALNDGNNFEKAKVPFSDEHYEDHLDKAWPL
ncbi:hypothetical protein F441_08262 [Phytophthora nicotianae CJ01A1]|uniref:START domain-containing protein n=1 Tax=Phytophthora nicotianae CJ01A1 TaxID=1317063 RepID=W2X4M2_PHYNI|nr:hypothetical protein F441_08262 [Phytophthora nicotianae CJ01A1]